MGELIPVVILGLIAWLWWGSSRAREAATAAAALACKQSGVQFLDETVVLRRLSLGRDSIGKLRLLRQYNFEFTKDGRERDKGYAIMLGMRLADMHLDLLVE